MKSVLVILSCFLFHLSVGKFPVDHIEPCAFTDSVCISNVAKYVLKYYSNGLPELGFPQIEPLKIEKLDIKQGGKSPVNIELNFKNGYLHGLSLAKIKSVTVSTDVVENSKIEFKSFMSSLSFLSDYKASGRILIVPVQGNGKSNITFEKSGAVVKFTLKTITKNGKEHLQVDKFKLRLSPSRLIVNFDGLFGGDPILGDSTNKFLNENWKDIYAELAPNIEEGISKYLKQVINSVFAKVPYHDLYKFT